MSYSTLRPGIERKEACSRAVLLARTAIHLLSPHPGQGGEDGERLIMLASAVKTCLYWTSADLARFTPLFEQVEHCDAENCKRAGVAGPKRLVGLSRSMLSSRDVNGPHMGDLIETLITVLTIGVLQHANWKLDIISAALQDPSQLRPSLVRIHNNLINPWLSRDSAVPEYSQSLTLIDQDFCGTVTGMTKVNALSHALNVTFSAETMDPSWTLRSITTAPLSDAAWSRSQNHYVYGQ